MSDAVVCCRYRPEVTGTPRLDVAERGRRVLPLHFKPASNQLRLGLDGAGPYGVFGARTPHADLTRVATTPRRRCDGVVQVAA